MIWTPPALLSDYTEAQWQRVVEEAAGYLGYSLQYHTNDSRRSNEGFPDLCLINPDAGRMVYFELKTDKKSSRPTVQQVEWVRGIRKTGVHAWIARPRNIDLVLDILSGKIAPPVMAGEVVAYNDALEPLVENEQKPIIRRRSGRRRATARTG